jgi:hypothetical protein
MATITLDYDVRNNLANKMIDIILAMDNVFKVKEHPQTNSSILTLKAMQDVEIGEVVTCDSYADYLKQTAEYA